MIYYNLDSARDSGSFWAMVSLLIDGMNLDFSASKKHNGVLSIDTCSLGAIIKTKDEVYHAREATREQTSADGLI